MNEQMTMIPFPLGGRDMKTEALKLRERMCVDSAGTFDEEEVLAAVIGFALPPEKAAGAALDLLDAFGSLKGVMEARPEMLRRVISKKAADMLACWRQLYRKYTMALAAPAERIGNSREAENYCKSLLAYRRTEAFYVISLNAQCKVIGSRMISEGSLSEVSAYPRIVLETALNYNAHSVLITHNHPGGTCAPSMEDINSTHQLQQLLNGIGILVLDHIIVANGNTYSMIQHGDIDYRIVRR